MKKIIAVLASLAAIAASGSDSGLTNYTNWFTNFNGRAYYIPPTPDWDDYRKEMAAVTNKLGTTTNVFSSDIQTSTNANPFNFVAISNVDVGFRPISYGAIYGKSIFSRGDGLDPIRVWVKTCIGTNTISIHVASQSGWPEAETTIYQVWMEVPAKPIVTATTNGGWLIHFAL